MNWPFIVLTTCCMFFAEHFASAQMSSPVPLGATQSQMFELLDADGSIEYVDSSEEKTTIYFGGKSYEYFFQNDVVYEIKLSRRLKSWRKTLRTQRAIHAHISRVKGLVFKKRIDRHKRVDLIFLPDQFWILTVDKFKKMNTLSLRSISLFHANKQLIGDFVERVLEEHKTGDAEGYSLLSKIEDL